MTRTGEKDGPQDPAGDSRRRLPNSRVSGRGGRGSRPLLSPTGGWGSAGAGAPLPREAEGPRAPPDDPGPPGPRPLRPSALGARPGRRARPCPPATRQPPGGFRPAAAPPRVDPTFWKAESERLNARDTQRDRDSIAAAVVAAELRAGGHRI